MRIESVFIHLIVWAILLTLWFCAKGFCCCFDTNMKDVCDLATVGGISSFAEISFALNTSIAIKWVRNQFMTYFDGFVERRIIKRRVKSDAGKISDDSTEEIRNQRDILKRRFDSMIRWPGRIYTAVGILFSLAIMVVLFAGIPVCLRPYVILLPFPAFAYYLTAIFTTGHIIANFDGFIHDKELPSEQEPDDVKSDVDSVKQSAKAKTSAKRNGNGRKKAGASSRAS